MNKIFNLNIASKLGLVVLLIGIAIINGYSKKNVVQKGDQISVHYVGSLKDGSIFDQSKGRGPLEFKVGSGQMIAGFDRAVIGMKLNEKKKVTLKPSEAYGEKNKQLIKEFPRNFFPKDFVLKKGVTIYLKHQSGRSVPGKILNFDSKKVIIDLNHPLAGKELIFDIQIIEIK